MIPLAVPNLAGNEARYLQECIDSGFVSTVGPFVQRLEEMVAIATESRDGVATSSGTTGLHAALVAVGIERDDLVIIPTLTFIATANAVAHCGALPWLFDVRRDSLTLDPDLLAERLAAETTRDAAGRVIHRPTGRRVAAVMPVYALGLPADMDALIEIARSHGLPVVADAAAALGARYRGRAVGKFGADLSVISFNGNKTVTAGGGGMVVGDDGSLMARLRHLTTTARVGNGYDHDAVGYNYRLTNLQAAVGCAQMELLDGFVATKRRIQARYDQALAGLPGVSRLPAPAWAESACWFAGVLVDRPPDAVEALRGSLRDAGIDSRPFWKPMHLQQPYRTAPATPQPVAEEVWQRIVILPCSTSLSAVQQDAVISAVRRLLG